MALVETFIKLVQTHWATYLIGFQMLLNLFGVGLIFFMAIRRKQRNKESGAILKHLHERVTDICCGINLDCGDLQGLNTRDREALRGIILKALESVSGTPRDNLVTLYKDLGFLSQDRSLLESKTFAKRLSALSRIERIQDLESGALVGKLLHDPSAYVHFAALKFLLKVRYPKLVVNIDKELTMLMELNRLDTATQILELYAEGYREEFLEVLRTHPQRKITNICLEVVLRQQITEALDVVKEQLMDGLRCEGQPEFAEFDFRKYTLCLTLVPDDECEDLLQRMMQMETASVRNVACLALLRIRPDLKAELTARLAEDESPQGKRLYRQLTEPILPRVIA